MSKGGCGHQTEVCARSCSRPLAEHSYVTPTAILSVSGDINILSVRDVVHKLHAIQWYVYMYVPGSARRLRLYSVPSLSVQLS